MRQALAPPPSAQAHECGHRPDRGAGPAEAIKAKGEGGKSGAIEPGSRDVSETCGSAMLTRTRKTQGAGTIKCPTQEKTVAIYGPDRGGDPSSVPCRSAEHQERPIRWLVLCPSSLPGPAKPAAGGARLSHTRSSEGLGEEAKGDQIATREEEQEHTHDSKRRTHAHGWRRSFGAKTWAGAAGHLPIQRASCSAGMAANDKARHIRAGLTTRMP